MENLDSNIQEVEAVELKRRKRCPFYGFSLSEYTLSMTDSIGNQCALAVKTFSSCIMEPEREVDFSRCPVVNNYLKYILECRGDEIQVSAREFSPNKISLKEWMEYVMR
jgi:hypothetical protein